MDYTKKALICANTAGFGSFLINDFKILIENGYSVFFACNTLEHKWDDTKEKLQSLNVNVLHVNFDINKAISKKNIQAYKEISKIFKEHHFDFVHCHTPIVGVLVRLAAKRFRKKGTKVLYTTHGLPYTEYSKNTTKFIYRSIERKLAKITDGIITINNDDFEEMKTTKCKNVYKIMGMGVDSSKFIDCKVNVSEYKTSLGLPQDKKIILSIGALTNRKNHQIVIKALSKLKRKDDYVYVICGAGLSNEDTSSYLLEIANKYNVNLKLLGFRHDIPNIIACSDIGVIPSIREGLGLAGIQMVLGGLPTIGSKVQGIKEYIWNDENGYLCSPFNEDEFADAIKNIDILSKTKIDEKKLLVYSKFDKKISNEQILSIYKLFI